METVITFILTMIVNLGIKALAAMLLFSLFGISVGFFKAILIVFLVGTIISRIQL